MKPAPESEVSRVRCEITERGPRIVIPIGGEEVVVSTERARRLRDEIMQALRYAESRLCPKTPSGIGLLRQRLPF